MKITLVALGLIFLVLGCAMGFTTWEIVRHTSVGDQWAYGACMSALFVLMGLGMLLVAPQ